MEMFIWTLNLVGIVTIFEANILKVFLGSSEVISKGLYGLETWLVGHHSEGNILKVVLGHLQGSRIT